MEPGYVEQHRKLLTPGTKTAGALLVLFYTLAGAANAQQNRITLRGHMHPKATSVNDRGRVSGSLQLSFVTLTLTQTSAQQRDLDELLLEQQTPGSPNYHRWLTPEEYADRFGVTPDSLTKIRGWLEGQGLTIANVARGRNWIAVNGSAAQIEAAFQTELHTYVAGGETHFANALDPSVPAAFGNMVKSVRGLHDFRMKPSLSRRKPLFTSPKGNHYLAPNDFATIYDVIPAYAAGFDGTGQKLVIAGQTQIKLPDIQQFRSTYNLPASDPQVTLVPGSRDPGISNGDLGEADLDLEWSGAVARNATILYVYANDVMQAVQYAIDQNLAPVVSTSYGLCELESGRADAVAFQSWAKQGIAQGITWIASTGDSGGADCNDAQNPGLSVDLPSSVPEITGVGGTSFQEGSGQFWNASNDPNNASVISYIPETSWNDSATDGSPSAGGGGLSTFFSKPSWQSGPGVPADNARHVPDVAMNASANHDGYLVYSDGSLGVYGGTSAPAPAFAGIVTLLNDYLVSTGKQPTPGVGNLNSRLYSLAQTASDIFHDITTGDNIVTVTDCPRRQTCTPTPVGFSAGPGYDLVTGLGSVNAWNLLTGFNGPAANAIPAITGLTDAASFQQRYAPGMILAVFGTQLAPSAQSADSVPLPNLMAGVSATVNGLTAPLYFVSPGQLNLQIPYETATSSPATLVINNNGQKTSQTLNIAPAAPGIFVNPTWSVAAGQIATLYFTGTGAVSPAISTGAAPPPTAALDALPAPAQNTQVTVGGVPAATRFIGIPYGLVGVTQINFQVPAGVPAGAQPVVVTVGGVSSAPANLVITN
jgi:uncharacterized protein (TIGR03437 family)